MLCTLSVTFHWDLGEALHLFLGYCELIISWSHARIYIADL